MAHRRSLIWAALFVLAWLGSSVDAVAGYAQASPPPEWSAQGFKPGPTTSVVRNAANEWAFWTKSNIRIQGRTITMPTTIKPAANAARFIAKRGFALGPGLAPMLAIWAVQAGLEWWWEEEGQRWVKGDPEAVPSDGYVYRAPLGSQWGVTDPTWWPTVSAACQTWFVRWPGRPSGNYIVNDTGGAYSCSIVGVGTMQLNRQGSTCPAGWYETPAGCIQTPPPKELTPQEFEDGLAPYPHKIPDEVIEHFPEPIPVQHPTINPYPDEWGNPRPIDVPVGDPKPNPRFDPEAEPDPEPDPEAEPSPETQPWTQPMVRVIPRSTALEPWRVELRPWERPQESPEPMEEPWVPAPVPPGGGESPPPGAIPGETPGLCDQYPGILACEQLGEAEEERLEEREQPFEFDPVPMAGEGSCPAPIEVEVLGRSVVLPWDRFCDSLEMIKPLMLAFAWASAAFILIGARES